MPSFRALILAGLVAAIFILFGLWMTDWLPRRDCADAQGRWNASTRTCLIDAKTYRVPG